MVSPQVWCRDCDLDDGRFDGCGEPQSALLAPGMNGLGQVCVVRAIRRFQDADRGGELFDGDVPSGGPPVPCVEGGDGVLGDVDAFVEPVDRAQPAVVAEVVAQLSVFVLELGAAAQDRLGAADSVVEHGLGGFDVPGGVGEFAACRAPPEHPAVGEVAFGEAPIVACRVEFGMGVGDGPIMRFTDRFEVTELIVEFAEPALDVGVGAFVSFDRVSCVSEVVDASR